MQIINWKLLIIRILMNCSTSSEVCIWKIEYQYLFGFKVEYEIYYLLKEVSSVKFEKVYNINLLIKHYN